MKTPSYWKDLNLLSILLLPLGWAYTSATKLNIWLHTPKEVNKTVICIGNITAGGTGKTPVSAGITQILQQLGKKPYIISRGYGGKLHGVIVNPHKHHAEDVGDEPLLLSKYAPVVVNPNRYEGAKLAIANGADIIVMDDGFQNQSLKKDLSFLVFDGEFGCGNGLGIPSGPLRESLSSGIKRAQAAIIIGEDKHNLAQKLPPLPLFKGKIMPLMPKIENKNVIAFAGIGRPKKFYNSLRQCGFNIKESINFPDHHYYTQSELNTLIKKAEKNQCVLFTTSKDMVKIPEIIHNKFNTLDIYIQWEDEERLKQFLINNI